MKKAIEAFGAAFTESPTYTWMWIGLAIVISVGENAGWNPFLKGMFVLNALAVVARPISIYIERERRRK